MCIHYPLSPHIDPIFNVENAIYFVYDTEWGCLVQYSSRTCFIAERLQYRGHVNGPTMISIVQDPGKGQSIYRSLK